MFDLRSVSKRYHRITALQDVHLRLTRGRTTVLIGPSGCGKSTLLRTLIGLVRPDAGEVYIDGERLRADNLLALRRRMGYVIQEGGLFAHLTAAGNVTLMARYLGGRERDLQSRLTELAKLTRLPAACLARYPGELSGGQRQRVSLMRALMLDPEALLMDEPLAALDPMIRAELQDDLKAVFARLNKTVVWVTHDLAEAAFFADRIVLLRAGRVIQIGGLDDLLQRPADGFVTDFVNAQRRLTEHNPA